MPTAIPKKGYLIAFAGYSTSGKSTAARFLPGYRLSFAYHIKKMLAALGLNHEELYGKAKYLPCSKLSGKTPQFAMQQLGTEWGRKLFGETFWVSRLMDEIILHQRTDPEDDIIIDDLRFHNEEKMIHDLGGIVIRIVRPGVQGSDHQSESEIGYLKTDGYVVNKGKEPVSFEKDVLQTVKDLKNAKK